jgi:transposase
MPWMETNVMKERLAFVHDAESGHWSMSELCERYGVSRPTGYKWLARDETAGGAGLADRSRTPQRCPHRTSEAMEVLIIAARLEYGWGAKKLLRVLRTRHPSRAWPARSTVNAILERHTLLTSIGAARSGRIRGHCRSPRSIPIRCGRLTSRASFAPATASTAIRSQ